MLSTQQLIRQLIDQRKDPFRRLKPDIKPLFQFSHQMHRRHAYVKSEVELSSVYCSQMGAKPFISGKQTPNLELKESIGDLPYSPSLHELEQVVPYFLGRHDSSSTLFKRAGDEIKIRIKSSMPNLQAFCSNKKPVSLVKTPGKNVEASLQ